MRLPRRRPGAILLQHDAGRAREAEYLDILLEQRVRGVLITPLDNRAVRLRALPEAGVPVVLLDRVAHDPSAWCSVSVDDVEGRPRRYPPR